MRRSTHAFPFLFDKPSGQIRMKQITLLIIVSLYMIVGSRVEASPVRSYEQQLEQVRLYINNDMFEAALAELNKLRGSEQGQGDERLYIALAKVNYKLHNITAALSDLRKARKLTKNSKAKKRLTSLYEQWLSTYGLVRFEPADQTYKGQLTLKRQRKLINQERKAALGKVQKLFEKGIELPLSAYLPYGQYSANGTTFKLKRNMPTPIVEVMLTPLKEVVQPPSSSNMDQWLYVGLGSAALVALGVGGYFMFQDDPKPNTQLTVVISDGR